MERDHQRDRALPGQVEVDRVIDVRADPLDVGGQRHGILVSGQLAVTSPPAAGQLVLADRKSRRVERRIEQQGQVAIEAVLDQARQEAARVGSHAASRARTLQGPHVQQHGRATNTLPR